MAAKEMFEKLGYKRKANDEYIQYFDHDYNEIYFWLKSEDVTSEDEWSEVKAATKDELKAIIAQAKELGWLDES